MQWCSSYEDEIILIGGVNFLQVNTKYQDKKTAAPHIGQGIVPRRPYTKGVIGVKQIPKAVLVCLLLGFMVI